MSILVSVRILSGSNPMGKSISLHHLRLREGQEDEIDRLAAQAMQFGHNEKQLGGQGIHNGAICFPIIDTILLLSTTTANAVSKPPVNAIHALWLV